MNWTPACSSPDVIQKKICMIGAAGVGKTSLVRRYVESVFSESYHSTIGVKVDKKAIAVDGTDVALVIWDLAGMEEWSSLPAAYVGGTSGYLLIVDGTRAATLATAERLQSEMDHATSGAPFLALVNKGDLAPGWQLGDVDVLLQERGWSGSRTSAKTGAGVEAAFHELTLRTLQA